MILNTKNTKEKGTIEFLVYPKNGHYIGVCLTFDIIEEGDNPVSLMKNIEEAAELHLEVVIKENMSDDLLNRYAPEEYWQKYYSVLNSAKKSPKSSFFIRSPYNNQPAVA